VGGMLKRHLAPETLERLLRNELMVEEAQNEGMNLSAFLSSVLNRSRKGEQTDAVDERE